VIVGPKEGEEVDTVGLVVGLAVDLVGDFDGD
jgi:hypothetical protein